MCSGIYDLVMAFVAKANTSWRQVSHINPTLFRWTYCPRNDGVCSVRWIRTDSLSKKQKSPYEAYWDRSFMNRYDMTEAMARLTANAIPNARGVSVRELARNSSQVSERALPSMSNLVRGEQTKITWR
jgi:hypothetical protein